ncbi:MAG: hypothetical protein AMXMBFR64_10960 [Myxococcales bacterium]
MTPARAVAILEPVCVGLVALAAFGWALLDAPGVTDNDAFFHMLMARRIASGELWPSIDSLPLTVLGSAGPDHHWLWHVVIAPIALLAPTVQGLEWAQAITAALVPVVLVILLRRWGAPWPALWAALAVTGALIMPFRVSELRAQNVAIVMIVAALWALDRERPRALAVIAFLFAQAYHGVVILAPLVLLHLGAVRLAEGRWTFRPAVHALVGVVAGFALSPWFPENLDYLLFHTLYKVSNPQGLDVGREWLSPPLTHVLGESWSAFVGLGLGVGLWGWARGWRARSATTLLLVAATVTMLLLYLKAWRFVEYFVPVAAVTAALLARDALPALPRVARVVSPLALALLVVAQGQAGIRYVHDKSAYKIEPFLPIGEALERLGEPGDIVFNTAWADFPLLLWVAPRMRFVTGLDPTYLHFQDAGRSALVRGLRAATPEDPHDPAPVIAEHLRARWVVVDPTAQGLAVQLGRSPAAKLVAFTPVGALFRLDVPRE